MDSERGNYWMGLRFRKSVKIAPGVKLNFNKKSTSVSIGGKHGGVTFNSKRGVTARTSLPGTGISYTQKIGGGKNRKAKTTARRDMTPHTYPPIVYKICYISAFVVCAALLIFVFAAFSVSVGTGLVIFAPWAFLLLCGFLWRKKYFQENEKRAMLNIRLDNVEPELAVDSEQLPESIFAPKISFDKDLSSREKTICKITNCGGSEKQESISCLSEDDEVTIDTDFNGNGDPICILSTACGDIGRLPLKITERIHSQMPYACYIDHIDYDEENDKYSPYVKIYW